MAVLQHHHLYTLGQLLKVLCVQKTLANIKSVDLGKHLEHSTHKWKVGFLSVIQVSDY